MLKRPVLRHLVLIIGLSILSNANYPVLCVEKLDSTLNIIEQEIDNKNLSKASLSQLIGLVHKNPTNCRAHILLGNACDSLGLPDQAMEQYKLAFKYGPNNPQSFLQLVKAQAKAGQLSAASSLLQQAIQRFPSDPQILLWTGNALAHEHRYGEARILYGQAMSKSSKPIAGISSALAHLSLENGQYSEALALAKVDLAHDKNLPQANEIAGLACLKMGKFEQSIPYLAIAFKNDRNNHIVALNYAQALIWSGQYNCALLPCLYALTNSPNFAEKKFLQKTLKTIAPHLSEKTIKTTLQEAHESDSLNRNPNIHFELANICLKKNLAKLAFAEYLEADKVHTQSAYLKYKLALIAEKYMHDYALALKYLRQAQVLEPYNFQINQYLLRLEDRLTINKSDWAWHLKDWLNS